MVIRAVVFDIGGVLEVTPDLGVDRLWETRLGLPAGDLNPRMRDVWRGGSIGTITSDDVTWPSGTGSGLMTEARAVHGRPVAGVSRHRQYRTDRVRHPLRPRYRTGIVSNSFVGAREREQAAYGFEDLVEEIVYSHEVGLSKPDPRIYALICTRLNVPPEEMIFLDDVDVCVAGRVTRACTRSATRTTRRPSRRSRRCWPARKCAGAGDFSQAAARAVGGRRRRPVFSRAGGW